MQRTNVKNVTHDEAEELSLRELAAPLFRHRKMLLITLLCVFAGVTAIGFLAFNKFRSEMSLLVNRERIDSLVSTGQPTQTITEPIDVAEEQINSEAELLVSQDILEKVVVANHLQDRKSSILNFLLPRQDEAHRIARAVRTLAQRIKVRPSTKANLIQVSYSASDPVLAHAVLNSLAGFYLEKHAEVYQPEGSYQFFDTQTQQYKRALDDAETRLRSFAQGDGGAAPDIERTDLDQQLASSIGQLHLTQQAAAADEERIASDQAQMKATPERSTTQVASAPADLLLQQLGADLVAAQTKQTQQLMKYDPSYPLAHEADQELAQTRAAFEKAQQTRYLTENTNVDATYELLREDLAKSKADLAAQHASLAANRASIANLQSQMALLAVKNLDQEDLLREQKADEANYLLYLSKREQARTSEALDKTRIENVAIATPPSMPVLPVLSPFTIVLLSLLVAAFVSVVSAYTVDYFDTSFHTPAEVVDILGIPTVVSISRKTA